MNFMSSLFQLRCPRCRSGNLFSEPFDFAKPLEMPDRCSSCQQKIEPEPGFYFGAMFLSYGISAWMLLFVSLILVFYFKWSVAGAMLMVLLVAALMYIKLLRFSRSLWIHMMIKYDPSTRLKSNEGL
jgi:uncharacterized protein (DUF983 family)